MRYISKIYVVDDRPVIQCNIREIGAQGRLRTRCGKAKGSIAVWSDHLPHRILVRDRDSVILFCNANYAKDLGLSPEAVIGKDAFAFYPREIAEAYHAEDREVMTSGMVRENEESYQVDGEERWIHAVKVPYRDEATKNHWHPGSF